MAEAMAIASLAARERWRGSFDLTPYVLTRAKAGAECSGLNRNSY